MPGQPSQPQSAWQTILGFLPQTSGLMKASDALGMANNAAMADKLKQYQDKYGPVAGKRIFDEEQAKLKGGAPPTH